MAYFIDRELDSKEPPMSSEETKLLERSLTRRESFSRIKQPYLVTYCVPRKTELEEVMTNFEMKKSRNGDGLCQIICGPPGIGKTQFAIAVYERLRRKYNYHYEFWIDGWNDKLIVKAFTNIARLLGIEYSINTTAHMIETVAARMRESFSLFLFDGVPNQNIVSRYLPTTKSHIVVTTRNCAECLWREPPILLHPFNDERTMDLAQRMGIPMKSMDPGSRQEFLSYLSKFPLALARMFTIMKEQNLLPRHIIDMYRSFDEFEKEADFLHVMCQKISYKPIDDYLPRFHICFQQQLDNLYNYPRDKCTLMIEMMSDFAFIHHEKIALYWVLCWYEDNDPFQSKIRRSLATLETTALINWNRSAQYMDTYRETQIMAKWWLVPMPEERRRRVKTLVKRLLDFIANPHKRKSQDDWLKMMLHHMLTLHDQLDENEDHDEIEQLAHYLYRSYTLNGQFEEALKWARKRLFMISGDKIIRDDSIKAQALKDVAQAFRNIDGIAGALQHYQAAFVALALLHQDVTHTDVVATREHVHALTLKAILLLAEIEQPDDQEGGEDEGGGGKSLSEKEKEELKLHVRTSLQQCPELKCHPLVLSALGDQSAGDSQLEEVEFE